MPDTVTAPAIGLAFATDDVAGVHWPYAKLAFGADGSAVVLADADGQRLPVAVPAVATTTRAYDWTAAQRLETAGAAAVRSAAIVAAEVMLHAAGDGLFRVGDAAVVAAPAAGSVPLAAGEKFHLRLTPGQFISFIRAGSSDAALFILPVAA